MVNSNKVPPCINRFAWHTGLLLLLSFFFLTGIYPCAFPSSTVTLCVAHKVFILLGGTKEKQLTTLALCICGSLPRNSWNVNMPHYCFWLKPLPPPTHALTMSENNCTTTTTTTCSAGQLKLFEPQYMPEKPFPCSNCLAGFYEAVFDKFVNIRVLKWTLTWGLVSDTFEIKIFWILCGGHHWSSPALSLNCQLFGLRVVKKQYY